MLDSDVARLYHYETKQINKSMKRNSERFPSDFCFQLTKDEIKTMWFQNGTTSEMIKFENIINKAKEACKGSNISALNILSAPTKCSKCLKE